MAIILSASRTPSRQMPRPTTPTAQAGLRYERRVVKKLQETKFGKVEPSPWFAYRRSGEHSDRVCNVDALLWDEDEGYIIVIEIKQSWVPAAIRKLTDLYCPVVSKALQIPVKPLVITRNLNPEAPLPATSLTFALLQKEPLIVWRENGPIII